MVRPRIAGSADLSFSDCRALLNDGNATEASLSLQNSQIVIRSEKTAVAGPATPDLTPPEYFDVNFFATSMAFEGAWTAVFSAVDKGTGIDHYEIIESKLPILLGGKWQTASSPYRLSDQSMKSYVFVKAVDGAGNMRIVMKDPEAGPSWFINPVLWCIIIISAVFALLLWRFRLRKK